LGTLKTFDTNLIEQFKLSDTYIDGAFALSKDSFFSAMILAGTVLHY